MKLKKSFKYALNMVIHARLRSWLTILGIVIGVAAVIAIVSLGNSLEQEMTSQFDDAGTDLLTITAGSSRAFSSMPGGMGGGDFGGGGGASSTEDETELDKMDVQVLRGISEVKLIETEISGQAEIYYVAEEGTVTVTGVDPSVWYQITIFKIDEGRLLGSSDTNVIVIGGNLAENFFDKQLGINQAVTIEGTQFRIVGILDDNSNSVYMPIDTAYAILDDKEDNVYDTIIVQVKDESVINSTIETIETKLMLSRHVTEYTIDFSISSNQEQQESREEMTSSLTTFLTAIAAVALLVGAVGVANTMFTSVMEKTKEIGIMKAIGARNEDIKKIFLINAGLIGFIGGFIGVILGIILSGVLPSLMGDSAGMLSRMAETGFVDLTMIFTALIGSMLIGMIAGFIPEHTASKLKPLDA